MKKNIFLSFRPEFFRPILYGIKKYEYRKRFISEPVTAYLYLSSPIREVIGIIELDATLKIDELLETYKDNEKIKNRLQNCQKNLETCAVPIKSIQLFKAPISRSQLLEADPTFHVPHSYLILENYPTVFNFLKNQPLYDAEFTHKHNGVYEENIGMYCAEMEKSEEYLKQHKSYTENPKYNKIKC